MKNIVLGFILVSAAAAVAAPPAKVAIEILHTNDLHGYLRTGENGNGGAGAMAALIEAARKKAKDDPAYDVVVLDGGDLMGGGAEDSFSRGKMMQDFIIGAGYDAYAIGNHDFGYGLETITTLSSELRKKGTAVLGVNIRNMHGGEQATSVADSGVILKRKGVQLGIVGATTPGVERMNLDENVAGLHFAEPIEPVKKHVRELQKQGATFVLMLSHVGLDNKQYVDDKKIAAAVKGIGAVVGGHSHTMMDKAFIEPTNKAVIVQAGSNGRWIGSLTLWFDGKNGMPLDEDKNGTIDFQYKLIELSKQPGAHKLADELKSKYWDPVQSQLEEVVGHADIGLYRKFYKSESQLGNLLADAMLDAAPGAVCAISATSELRGDIRRGEVRNKDIFETVPFDNEVVKTKVGGFLIKEVLDSVFGDGRRFVNVAGMEVLVDSRKPEGQRVVSITIAGKPLDENAQYELATTDFIVQGKGGFKQFQKPPYTKTGVSNRDALAKRIKKLGTVVADSIPMRRIRDAALEEEIGRVKRTFSTEMTSQAPNIFDIVAQAVLGKTPRGDLALIDSSPIHWKLTEKFPVVKKDLYELVSYDNQVVTAPITGEQLTGMFTSMLAKGDKRFNGYVAGGHLIINGTKFELLIGDKPVEAGKTYKLVTYDHLLTGPKGFEALGALKLTGTNAGLQMRPALEQWIKAVTPIDLDDFPSRPGVVVGADPSRTVDRVRNFERMRPQGEDDGHDH
jgi:5'-nucleotidase/UDP-sugar diphosphatase